MARCISCASINADKEAKRHNNFYTRTLAKALGKRVNNSSRKMQPHLFCRFHALQMGTGRPTEKLEAIPKTKELLQKDLMMLKTKIDELPEEKVDEMREYNGQWEALRKTLDHVLDHAA